MPSKYQNLLMNICDLTIKCDLGDFYTILKPEKGLCFGLAFMWGQAVLAQDEKTFIKRLDLLTDHYPILTDDYESKMLSQIINDVRQKVKQRKHLSQKEELYLSIIPFFDGIIMYHKPQLTSIYQDRADHKLHSQHGENSSRYVINDTIAKIRNGISTPITKCFDRPFVGTRKEYNTIINSLVESVNQLEVPFFVHLGSENHSVALSILNKKILVFDANAMSVNAYYYPYQEDKYLFAPVTECVRAIFKVFQEATPLAINIAVHLRPEDADKSMSIMNKMFSQKMTEGITEKLIRQLTNYSELHKWQWNNQRGRASFTAGHLKQITCLIGLKEYLTKEKQLCSGTSVSQCRYSHYNNNLPATRNGKEAYYQIIDKALKNLSQFMMHGEYEKYTQYFLPRAIEKKFHTKTLFLYIACSNGHLDVVRALLKTPGIRHNQTDGEGATPLYIASQNGHAPVVRVLLKTQRIDVNKQADESTPLQVACKYGHTEVVSLLIKARGIDINQPTRNGTTALVIACNEGHDKIIQLLLNRNPRKSRNFNEYQIYKGRDLRVQKRLNLFCKGC
ncbi:MAG: ankyrin repeat domain-containing protein [Desulfobacteraceae bacterium]|nr:ankyrin repeat domain-containing protein [Desulfobacteraceae bacterium]